MILKPALILVVQQRAETFNGVMVAGIRTSSVGSFLKNQSLSQSKSGMGLLDKKGVILYSDNSSYVGKYILGDEFQHRLSGIISPNSDESTKRPFEKVITGQ